MTGFDLSTISDCYVGSLPASEIYLGNTKVWPTIYAEEYLTFTALNSCTFRFISTIGNTLDYSTNHGRTWTTLPNNTPTPTIASGTKIMWRCTNTNMLISSGIEPNYGIGYFRSTGPLSSTGDFNVSGNIMSLLYKDNFINQTDLTGKAWVFERLFYDCNIINADNLVLPATTLAEGCYKYMFADKLDLITAPELPATTLANNCYNGMFASCTSLTTAPELPATTLSSHCYEDMFNSCYSLTTAPELPATTLEQYCYNQMFQYCRSLNITPELPATTLRRYCYADMFSGCTSLITVQTLPATRLVECCYQNMFNGCTRLNEVHCDATDISGWNCLNKWLNNVSQTGDFYKPSTTTYPSGASGIPTNWTIHNIAHDYSQDYLTLEALEAGTFTWTDTQNSRSISYSTDDGSTWTTLTAGSTTPTIAANSKVLLKATLGAGNFNGNGTISSSGRFNVMGNIMSLVGGDNFNNLTVINDYQFNTLFRNCTKLIDASNLILPATTMRICCYRSMFQACSSLTTAPQLPATTLYLLCYQNMFQNCSSLTTAPTLPATTLAMQCYVNMFNGCTSLTTAPALPATTLVDSCYASMFQNCRSLTTAPELPATTLASSCYNYMFFGCSSLTTAPELPATTLASSCYTSMFYGCKNINYIKCLATNISASNCTNNWVQNVAATGTFVKNASMTSWTTGNNGVPSGWTVQDATA